jgi:adenine-specific DNA-methyltransferase
MSDVEEMLDAIHSAADNFGSIAIVDASPRIESWIDQHGLNRLDDPTPVVCRLTAYNWLLKASLYDLYRSDGIDLPALQSAENAQSCFSLAADKTLDNSFSHYALDEIAERVDKEAFKPLLDARPVLINADDPLSDIPSLFEKIVPREARRKLGQFRTPEHIADLMAEWAVRSGDDVVLDPGMGAGVLTASLYEAKQTSTGPATVEEMWGVDLSQLAVIMSSVTLKLVNGNGQPNLHQGDFMDIPPEGTQKRIHQDQSFSIPKLDGVVSNPPYSRHHAIAEAAKSKVNDIAEADSAMTISKQAPMYMYFYIHAAEFLREHGRMAFVTPSEFLETNYGRQLKEFLLNNFSIHGIVLSDQGTSIFEEARTTSCITFLEKNDGGDESCGTTFIKLDEWAGIQPVIDAVDSGATGLTEYGYINRVPQGTLDPNDKWTKYFDPDPELKIGGLRSFREIATIKRGIATGANDYFCLSKEQREHLDLDESYFTPVIRRADRMPYYNCTLDDWKTWLDDGDAVQLLYHLPESAGEVEDEALADYLERGVEEDIDERYLSQERNPWYLVDRRDVPDILGTYMSKKGFRFIFNEAGVRSLNNFHNIQPNDGYSEDQINALLAYLNSGVVYDVLSQKSRTYSENMEKIEPNELKEIPVIDPAEIGANASKYLSECFKRLCRVKRDPGSQEESAEEVIDDIDSFLKDILEIRYQ